MSGLVWTLRRMAGAGSYTENFFSLSTFVSSNLVFQSDDEDDDDDDEDGTVPFFDLAATASNRFGNFNKRLWP